MTRPLTLAALLLTAGLVPLGSDRVRFTTGER